MQHPSWALLSRSWFGPAAAASDDASIAQSDAYRHGESSDPLTFSEILELPMILLRQGPSARAIVNDVNLLKKIESHAKLQMNSVQAIAGALETGLGCVIGTRLFMQDQIARGTVHVRPIIEPELSRTLHLCELTSRPPTFALEAVRDLLLELVGDAVRQGRWEAKLIKA